MAKRGRSRSLSKDLIQRATDLLSGRGKSNLLETVLHCHLLLERGLDRKIALRMKKPETVENDQLQLRFTQKILLYDALFGANPSMLDLLQGFNKLRNAVAHRFVNIEDEIRKAFPNIKAIEQEPGRTLPLLFAFVLFYELEAKSGSRKKLARVIAELKQDTGENSN